MRAQTNYQGGSLLGFVAIGILLAGLLVGGLYFVQRYNNSDADNGGIVASEGNTDEKNTSGFTDDNESSSANNGGNTDGNATKDDQSDNTATDAEESTTNESGAGSSAENTAENSNSSSVNQLPETGPADTMLQASVLSVVTYGVVSYVRSRRSLDF